MNEPEFAAGAGSQPITVSDNMLDALRATKPWVRLIAVVGFIWAGLVMLGGIAILIDPSGARQTFAGTAVGIIDLVLALIYFFPCLFLFGYASAIGDTLNGGGGGALEKALERQRLFWHYAGILALIGLVLGIIAFVATIILGITGLGLGSMINR
ncbi:MAG TPA: DUF5362 family protein [Gammaproteobacteria bacterium]|nr:DUF5362 family protein [Gammaproteobacteria bacterium]